MLHTLAKDVWGAFALRHLTSPSFLLVDGEVIYIAVPHSVLRNHLCCVLSVSYSENVFNRNWCPDSFCVHNLPLLI